MDSFGTYLFIAAVVVTYCGVLACFDRLFRIEARSHPTIWMLDGQPVGLHSSLHDMARGMVPDRRSPESRLAFMRLSCVWLFRTPDWIRQDRQAHFMLVTARLLAFLCVGELSVLLDLHVI